MAEVTPPLFQTIDAEYTGASLGLPYRDIVSEGVAGTTDLQVTERGAGANMSVDVAAGVAWVKGDDSAALQPTYRVYNDATKNLAVTAADGTNPRIDLVIAEVRDAAFSGVSTDWRLRVVAGTPAGSPAAPATPSNAVVLARLSVPAADTTIGTAQITDYRPRAGLFSSLGVPTVTALPAQPYDGQVVDYVADDTNGVIWRLKYREASASSYKWEFVGGPPLAAEVATAETRNNAAFGDLTTVGPSVTTPLVGDYAVYTECRVAGSGVDGLMSYDIGGTGAVDADCLWHGVATNATTGSPARTQRKNALAASTALVSKYRTGGSVTFSLRRLAILPIRVG